MYRRTSLWFGVGALFTIGGVAAAGTTVVGTSGDFAAFSTLREDAATAAQLDIDATTIDQTDGGNTGSWQRQIWDTQMPDYSAHYRVDNAADHVDECVNTRDIDGAVEPLSGTNAEAVGAASEWYVVGANVADAATTYTLSASDFTYDSPETLAPASAISVPATYDSASEVRFLTSGARAAAALDYTVTLSYGDGSSEVFTIPIEPIGSSSGRNSTGPNYTVTGLAAALPSAGGAHPCGAAVYGDEVVITNPHAATKALTTVTFAYTDIVAATATGDFLPGPMALALGAGELEYNSTYTYTGEATSGNLVADALKANVGADNAWFARIQWDATFDLYGDIFLFYRCGDANANGTDIDWDTAFQDLPADGLAVLGEGLSTRSNVDGDGTVELGLSACQGQYIQVKAEIVSSYNSSPILSQLAVHWDIDADADGVTSGGLFDPSTGVWDAAAGFDTDCDDGDPALSANTTYFTDADGDGDGDPANSTSVCAATPPVGTSTNSDDCRDTGAGAANYNANGTSTPETDGDGNDYNCDGVVTCYADADGDGDGAISTTVDLALGSGFFLDCNRAPASPPALAVGDGVLLDGSAVEAGPTTSDAQHGDCNDSDASFNTAGTAATESPVDGIDYDCDGNVSCYVDADGDDFGTTLVARSAGSLGGTLDCDVVANSASVDGDCNDDLGTSGGSYFPGALEDAGTGSDFDCSADIVCFADGDGDGDGVSTQITIPVTAGAAGSCDRTAGENAGATPSVSASSANSLDCRDTGANAADYNQTGTHPAESTGDGNDYDCDGLVTCYADNDGDGDGAISATTVLRATNGVQSCDRPSASPPSAPVGDGVINDATGVEAPPTTATDNGDCNDADPNINTNGTPATESPTDGVDYDCDGFVSCFEDLDGDDFGSSLVARSATGAGGTVDCTAGNSAEVGGDCNDVVANDGASFFPTATEAPGTGRDLDCDSDIECYIDADDDGDGSTTTVDIAVAAGFSGSCDRTSAQNGGNGASAANPDDCQDSGAGASDFNTNDLDGTRATEAPADGNDYDCDGLVACFPDDDEDGQGDEEADLVSEQILLQVSPGGFQACQRASGDGVLAQGGGAAQATSSVSTDCNDANPGILFDAVATNETPGNAVDENCDDQYLCYEDADGDGYGLSFPSVGTPTDFTLVPAATPTACQTPSLDASDIDGDCNDSPVIGVPFNPDPTTTNTPGDLDDFDCDGTIPCYPDADQDGEGDADALADSNAWVQVAATGGEGGSIATCVRVGVGDPTSDNADDCNDDALTGAPFNTSAPEATGQGTDFDCSGDIACYRDADRDGHGDLNPATPTVTVTVTAAGDSVSCDVPASQRSDANDDCDDSDAAISPSDPDVVGQGIDNDCSGTVNCYLDSDGDGFGNDAANLTADLPVAAGGSLTCGLSNQGSTLATDCQDGIAAVNPGATTDELGVSPQTDFDCSGDIPCWTDADGDGRGNDDGNVTLLTVTPGTQGLCTDQANSVATDDDCNDANDVVFDGAAETTGDGIDNNCDGDIFCYVDADQDGFGSAEIVEASIAATLAGSTLPGGCANPSGGYSDRDDDCLDCFNPSGATCGDSAGERADAATVNPGLSQVEALGNLLDEECDGSIACYPDLDGDTFGSEATLLGDDSTWAFTATVLPATGQGLCLTSAGHSLNGDDCHDEAGLVTQGAFPGAQPEIPGNDLDDNCDGVVDCLYDADGDGFARAQGAGTGSFDGSDWSPTMNLAAFDNSRLQVWGSNVNPAAPAIRNANERYTCDPLRNEAHLSAQYDCYDEADQVGALIYPGAAPDPTPILPDYPNGTGTGSGIDQDCELTGEIACFEDADGDTFGGTDAFFNTGFPGHLPGHSPDNSINVLPNPCLDPANGFAANGLDCHDDNPAASPSAPGEIAGDAFDNDCDDLYDCFQDLDGDGYGTKVIERSRPDRTTSISCEQPALGFAIRGGSPDETYSGLDYDCHDDNELANPGITDEVDGNAFDDDCDGIITCFRDLDEDDWGTEQLVSITVDWRDIHLGVGAVGPVAQQAVFTAGDSDVWATFDCDLGVEIAAANPNAANPSFDCHDTNSLANPGISADPAGNAVGSDGQSGRAWDEDCNGVVQCYRDGDDDGFGTYIVDLNVDASRTEDPAAVGATPDNNSPKYISKIGVDDHFRCDNNDFNWAGRGGAPGVVSDADDFDCHDDNASVFPNANGDAEEAGNAYDDNCDGLIDCYEDLDNDGFGTVVVSGITPSEFELVEADGFAQRDNVSAVVSGYKLYVCGLEAAVDAGVTNLSTAEQDEINTDQRAAKGGAGTSNFDCHDDFAGANPGVQSETPGASSQPLFGVVAFDEDCDGFYTCYEDLDNDDYGTVERVIDRTWVPYQASIASTNDNGVYSCELAPVGQGGVGETEFEPGTPVVQQTFITAVGGGSWADGNATFDCHDTNANANPGVLAESPGDSDALDAQGSSTGGLSWDENCDGYVECYRDLDADDYGTYVVNLNVDGVRGNQTETIGLVTGQDYFDCDQSNRPWAGIGGVLGDADFDCHDDEPTANPGAAGETAGDAWDNDCDGFVQCYEDLDNDEFGTDEKDIVADPATGIPAPSSFDRSNQTDEAAGLLLYPCGVNSATDAGLDLTDTGDTATQDLLDALAADRRAEIGGAGNPTEYDCHDDWDRAFPQFPAGRNEIAGDPFDNNCDGFVACYEDRDGDGFGNRNAFDVQVRTDSTTLAPNGTLAGYDYDNFPFTLGKGVLPSWPVRAFDLDDPAGEFTDISEYRSGGFGSERAARQAAITGLWFNCQEMEDDQGDAIFAAGGGDGTFLDCHDDVVDVHPGFDDSADEVSPFAPEDRLQVSGPDAVCGGPVVCVVGGGEDVEIYDATIGACCANFEALDNDGDPQTTCPNSTNGFWRCFEGTSSTDNGEVPGDAFDNDCDGVVLCYLNKDNDNTGTVATRDDGVDQTPTAYDDGLYSCAPTGSNAEAEIAGDCHDNNSAVEPPQAARDAAAPGEDARIYISRNEPLGGSNQITTSVEVSDFDDDGSCANGVIFCHDPNNDVLYDKFELEALFGDGATCDAVVGTYRCYLSEVVGDQFDQDCDGAVGCYYDGDQDDYGVDPFGTDDNAFVRRASESPLARTTFPGVADNGWYDCSFEDRAPATTEFDCNDDNFFENPNGIEVDDILALTDAAERELAYQAIGNNIDEDCDGTILCWADEDNDGWGGGLLEGDVDQIGTLTEVTDGLLPDVWTGTGSLRWSIVEPPDGRTDCLNPGVDDPDEAFTGVSNRNGDCHDDTPDASPTSASVPGDSFDNNCDGEWLCYLDADGDGFGSTAAGTVPDADGDRQCISTDAQEADNNDDCLDDNDLVAGISTYDINILNNRYEPGISDPPTVAFLTNPTGLEFYGDEIDGDCDGFEKCFVDVDGDGFVDGSGAGAQTDILGRTGRIFDVEPLISDDLGKVSCGDIRAGRPREIPFGDGTIATSRWPDEAPFAIALGANTGLVNAFVEDGADFESLGIFDCDDTNADVKPQGIGLEVWYDGIDQNCDNRSDFDQDLDGYDDAAAVEEFGRPACPEFGRPGETRRRYEVDPVIGCGPGRDNFDNPTATDVFSINLHPAPYDRGVYTELNGNGTVDFGEDIEKAALEQICEEDPDFYLCACSGGDLSACPCPSGTNLEICNDALALNGPVGTLDTGYTRPIMQYENDDLLKGIPGLTEQCETQGTPQIDDDADGNPNTTWRCWFNYELYLSDLDDFAQAQRDSQLPWRPPSRELYTFCLDPEQDTDYFVDRSDPLDYSTLQLNSDPDLVAELVSDLDDQFAGFEWDPNWIRPANPEGRYYRDIDDDGEGDENHQGVWLCDLQYEVDAGRQWRRSRSDCDDNNETINRGGIEVCDRADNNCDDLIDEPTEGLTDEIDTSCEYHYIDQDGDSWGLRDADENPERGERFCICPFYEKLELDGIIIREVPEPQECAHFVSTGDEATLAFGHSIGGACFVKNNSDCDDLNFNIKPFAPGDEPFEYIDGIDNDCNNELPLIELDCDDDNAYPFLPRMSTELLNNPTETPVYDAESVGLEPCCVLDAVTGECRAGAPPNALCWGERLPLRCDTETRLWVVDTSALIEFGKYDGAARIPRQSDCISWDCDDQCSARCAGIDEQCDGIDNDCNGFAELATGTSEIPIDVTLLAEDFDGVPDVMQVELTQLGLVDANELDLDGDQHVSCAESSIPGADNQRAITDRSCREYSQFSDCNDRCVLASPASEESRCNGFVTDDVCSEEFGTDGDGDGYLSCGTYGSDIAAEEEVYALVFSRGSIVEFLTNDVDLSTVVPLIPPRRYVGDAWDNTQLDDTVRECDQPLEEELRLLINGRTRDDQVDVDALDAIPADPEDVRRQLLEVCVLADTCRELSERFAANSGQEQANDNDDAVIGRPDDTQAPPAPPVTDILVLPEYCDALEDARCSVVRLTLGPDADLDIYEVDESGAGAWPDFDSCVYDENGALYHPEQAITRTVWNKDQIVEARKLVVDYECYRMFGTMGCQEEGAEMTDVLQSKDNQQWVSPYQGQLPGSEGFFDLPQVPDEVYLWQENKWWLQMGRYSPTSIQGGGTLVGCWGDPHAVDGVVDQIETIELVGGDCTQVTDERGKVNPADANRGMAEGPSDLVGWYTGDPVACATCLDGVDNNCNQLIDAEDPACAQCFIGQGYGCGCSAGNGSSNVGRTASPLLILWALMAAFARRRERT